MCGGCDIFFQRHHMQITPRFRGSHSEIPLGAANVNEYPVVRQIRFQYPPAGAAVSFLLVVGFDSHDLTLVGFVP